MKIINGIFFLMCAWTFSASAQTLSDVVDRYLSASGGRRTWDKINSLRKKSKVWQNLDYLNLPDNHKSSIDNKPPEEHQETNLIPFFSVVKMKSPEGDVATTYSNDRGGGILKAGLYFDIPIHSFVTIAMAKNILLLSEGGLLKYDGEGKLNEEDCYTLVGPYDPESSVILKFFFSKNTGLLIATRNENKNPVVTVKFKDYRTVGDATVPFQKESYAGDILFSKEVIEELEFNPYIDKSIFYYSEKAEQTEVINSSKEIVINRMIEDESLTGLVKKNFSGKRLLIDIWATWCAPCKIQFQKYDSIFYKTLAELEVNMLYISIDKVKDRKKWESDIYKFNLKGQHVLAKNILLKSIQEIVFKNQPIVIPRYVVFDERGNLLSIDFTRPGHQTFADELRMLFNNKVEVK